jgi:hypothetical protein
MAYEFWTEDKEYVFDEYLLQKEWKKW